MEEGNGIETGEFLLPEDIIQHIQSFLNGKQAAKTSTLCKLWYNAWLTHPILDLDELYFSKRGHGGPKSQIADGFADFARNTLRRYKELNLKIDSFRLSMKNTSGRSSLARELIVKALKMGVSDLSFEINPPDTKFVLPHVVLGSENLTRLSVRGCKISLPVFRKISCSKLKFLSLSKVCIIDELFWDIASCCPLIEKLSFSECGCPVAFATVRRHVSTMWIRRTPSIGSCEFHRLKSLSLHKAAVNSLLSNNFSRNFPCLEDLSLLCCYGSKEIRISSYSLKCINLKRELRANRTPLKKRIERIEFDVPSIRKFVYSGASIPNLSFQTASGEWESNITISCSEHHVCANWFTNLKKLLIELRPSKISLNLKFKLAKYVDCEGLTDDLAKPVVENLMVSVYTRSAVRSSLLDGLFWSFRPKFITLYWLPCVAAKENNYFLKVLCKRLIQEASQYRIMSQNMCDLHELEEANVEVFKQTLAEWQPLPWKSLLDASAYPEIPQKIRFRLKWISPSRFAGVRAFSSGALEYLKSQLRQENAKQLSLRQ